VQRLRPAQPYPAILPIVERSSSTTISAIEGLRSTTVKSPTLSASQSTKPGETHWLLQLTTWSDRLQYMQATSYAGAMLDSKQYSMQEMRGLPLHQSLHYTR
jgi:hypothetical protein